MRSVIFLFVIASALSSCEYFGGELVSGNGHIVTQTKNVNSFTSIEARGSVNVHVRQDSVASVKVEGDENLLEYIEVSNDGNTLVISTKKGFNLDPTKDIIIYASAPKFENIELSGSCDVVSDNVISGTNNLSVSVSGSGDIDMQVNLLKVQTKVSGSGTVTLRGTTNDFLAEVRGSGDVKCFGLISNKATLDLSGSSDAEVSANQMLDIKVAGSGSVRYKGNASVKQRISGSGSIEKVG